MIFSFLICTSILRNDGATTLSSSPDAPTLLPCVPPSDPLSDVPGLLPLAGGGGELRALIDEGWHGGGMVRHGRQGTSDPLSGTHSSAARGRKPRPRSPTPTPRGSARRSGAFSARWRAREARGRGSVQRWPRRRLRGRDLAATRRRTPPTCQASGSPSLICSRRCCSSRCALNHDRAPPLCCVARPRGRPSCLCRRVGGGADAALRWQGGAEQEGGRGGSGGG